jgi:hypothetical protein
MSLTSAQRARINRRNAQKSTGPRTDAGKAASRLNAIKHGLRAQTVPLPVEDPDELAALADEWVDYYRPASPAEREAVERAVRSVVQRRRCQRFQDAAAAEQVRTAAERWDRDRQDEVERIAETFADDPAGSVRALGRTAAGCAWMAERWKELRHSLNTCRGWLEDQRHAAARLCGVAPPTADDYQTGNPEASIPLLALYWQYQDTRDREDRYRRKDALVAALDQRIAALEERAGRLRVTDEPGRAAAVDMAVLPDGPAGALLLRYERAHATEFHRAVNLLMKLREAAVEPAFDDADDPAPPNEANRADEALQVLVEDCVTPAAAASVEAEPRAAAGPETERVVEAAPPRAREAGPEEATRPNEAGQRSGPRRHEPPARSRDRANWTPADWGASLGFPPPGAASGAAMIPLRMVPGGGA